MSKILIGSLRRHAFNSAWLYNIRITLALAGTTGWSTACHLHFEVYTGGGTTNPASFLRDRGVWV